MNNLSVLKEIIKSVPLMDSENIINIIEDYSEIEYYKNHNQPIRLELEYTMMGSLDEINIVYRNEYFYLLKESTRDSSIIYCKYDNERNIKYYEYDYSKMNCDCPIHKGAKMHTYYKEYKLKLEKEGFFYVEKNDKRKMDNELEQSDYVLQKYQIDRQISMNEIEVKIELLEELYKMYKEMERVEEELDDGDELYTNKLVYYRDNIYYCTPFSGKATFEFFKKVIDKDTSFIDI
jgi:hypothetical protein